MDSAHRWHLPLVAIAAVGFCGCVPGERGAAEKRPAIDEPSAAPDAGTSFGVTGGTKPTRPTRDAALNLKPMREEEAEVSTTKFNSSRICGACHTNIFAGWSRGMHAQAFVDPIFQDAFAKAYYASGGEAAKLCLRCHSPTVSRTKDYLGKLELTREGVTCDYCHSIDRVEEKAGKTTYTIDLARKHGPFKQASSPAHDIQYREHFERSEICAGCHDYTSPEGVVVFSTYSEWKASSYAKEGKQCQHCHMPRLAGGTVTSTNGKSGRQVYNDHTLAGGHSPAQVKRAVVARIDNVSRDADRVRVQISIENSGAGHMVPTGLPSRKLVLTLKATQRGRSVFQQKRTYQRIMQGDGLEPLVEDWRIKLYSKRVLRDTRIRPGEVRQETFVFTASRSEDVVLNASLTYEYEPKIATKHLIEIPIVELEHVIQRGL